MNPSTAYIVNKPEPFRSILIESQLIIESAIPELELKFKYNIPFYYLNNKPFCYMNVRKDFVDIGFPRGYLLSKYENYLTGGEKRVKVKSLRFNDSKEIDGMIFVNILNEVKKLYY